MVATLDDLSRFADIADRNGFGSLSRVVEVLTAWSQSGKVGDIDVYYARNAARELSELLPKLPELTDYNSEVEFVLGYKPLEAGLLPDEDAALVRTWQAFRGQAFRNLDVSERDDAAVVRDQWITLIHDLATFLGRRRRIAQVRAGRRS